MNDEEKSRRLPHGPRTMFFGSWSAGMAGWDSSNLTEGGVAEHRGARGIPYKLSEDHGAQTPPLTSWRNCPVKSRQNSEFSDSPLCLHADISIYITTTYD